MTEYVASDSLVASTHLEQSSASTPISVKSKPVSEVVVTSLVAVADAVAMLCSGFAALLINTRAPVDLDRHFAAIAVAFGALLMVNIGYVMEAYRFASLRRPKQAVATVMLAWLGSVFVLAAVFKIADVGMSVRQAWVLQWLAGSLGLLLINRALLGHLFEQWSKTARLTRCVAIVGAGDVAERIVAHLSEIEDHTVTVVGVYEDRQRRVPDHCAGFAVCGSIDDLVFDIRHQRIDAVIVALPLWAEQRLTQIVEKLRQTPVTVTLCPEWFDRRAGAYPMGHIGGVSLLCATEPPLHDWRGIAKSVEDRILAVLILAVISPILAAIAVAVKLDSPGPALFRQKRYGFNNELIEVFKFRSMYHHKSDANAEQLTRRNDPRVTRIGAFLRRTSLDEFPQFINVLRGEMSIVGPRPHALAAKAGGVLYPEAVQYYHSRHRVKPGITGWAQINGWRGETETVEQIVKRVEHDLYYVEHWSVLFDLRIIMRTILGGFTGRHAY